MPAHHGPSPQGGVLSTLLMTAPLLLVPALAAVGLPEVGGGDEVGDDFTLELPDPASDGSAPRLAAGAADAAAAEPFAFADSGDAPATPESAPTGPAVRTASLDDAAAFGGARPRAARTDPLIETAGRSEEPTGRSTGAAAIPGLTARLAAAGATDIRLSGGDVPGSYYAGCSLVTDANPRVVRRFEAEAGSPADAVRSVLDQVTGYRAAASQPELTSAAL